MLTPEDLDKAGELVGGVYTDIEAEMLDYLAAKMIDGDITGQRSQTALMLLAQSSTADLRGILDAHGPAIDSAVRREVEGALGKSDADDLRKIKRGLGVELEGVTTRQTAATVAGVHEILARHNLQMEQGAKDAFIAASAEAMTFTNTGAMTAQQALHRAVRKLERDGITVIQYQNAETGAKTVANKIDVAVRRHVRTQVAQAGARLTEQRMDEAGVEFVEVSSHTGARPSHREWEGGVYSRHGRRTVDGVTYEDFHEACHWGDVADGIYGANCRHAHGPWIPGTPRTYGKDPQHPSGLDNDEIYDLTQRQREIERDIRATKREIRGCEIEYEKTGSLEAQADAAKLKARLRDEQEKMRAHIEAANARCKPGTSVLQRAPQREWAGDMPRTKTPAPANRKLDDVLAMPSVEASRKSAGIAKAELRKAVVGDLTEDGLATQSFRWLTVRQQVERVQDAMARLADGVTGTAKASRGKHAAMQPVDELHPQRIAGVIRTKAAMTFDEADGSRANPKYDPSRVAGPHETNCQASVLAHEARRRGYDVQAKGYDSSNGAMKALAMEPYMAYHEPGDAAAVAQKIKPSEAPTFARFHKICEDTVKPGERYQLRFTSGGGSGHVVSLDRTAAGELRIHDPQSGQTYVGKKAREYMKRIKFRSKSYGMDVYEDNYIYRVDDKALNSKVTDEVLEARA